MGFQLHTFKLISLQDFLNIQDHFYWVTEKKKRRDFDLHAVEMKMQELLDFQMKRWSMNVKWQAMTQKKGHCSLTDVDSC